MVMRGPAPSYACPRCATEAVPTGHRLLSCATCKLTFDARTDRPRPARRAAAPDEVPAGVEVDRTGDALAIRLAGARVLGLAVAVGSMLVALVLLRLIAAGPAEYGVGPIGLALAALAGCYWGLAQAMGTRVIRLDARALTSGLVPLALPPRLEVPRGELAAIDVERTAKGFVVTATRRDGRTATVATLELYGAGGEELARYVADVLAVGLAARSSRTS